MRLIEVGSVAVLALVLAGCAGEPQVAEKKNDGPLAVRAAAVTDKKIQRSVDSVGTLYPYEEVIVSAEIDGRVDKVNHDLGDAVNENDVLVHISDEEQRYVLAQNEAQLRQSLERLGLEKEDDKVRDIDETPEVRRAKADLVDAEQRYKRVRDLVDQKIGAPADLDQAEARLNAMQAGYDATRNQARNLIQEVERMRAQTELQRKKLRDTNVRAPFQAEVKEKQVTMGQFVRANTPLFTLVKTNPLRLRLEVPERMAPWTKVGQSVEVSMEAFQDRKFQGKIWRISPTVDETKRTFVAEALIDNPGGILKAGSYAKAHMMTEKVDQVLIAPFTAVNYVLGVNKAFVVRNGEIEARDVTLGDRFDDDVEIVEGLKLGETVATSQLNRLDTGVKVRVAAAGEAPPGAAAGKRSD